MTVTPNTCIRCGEQLKPGDRFCERCGNAVEEKDSEADNKLGQMTPSQEIKPDGSEPKGGSVLSTRVPLRSVAIVIIIALGIISSMMFYQMEEAKSNKGFWKYKGDVAASTNKNKLGEAIQYYDRAIELDPKYSEAFEAKGYALKRLGQLNESLENFATAVKNDKNNFNAWQEEGNIYIDQGKENDAISCLDESINVILDLAIRAYGYKYNALERDNRSVEAEWVKDNITKLQEMKPLSWRN